MIVVVVGGCGWLWVIVIVFVVGDCGGCGWLWMVVDGCE